MSDAVASATFDDELATPAPRPRIKARVVVALVVIVAAIGFLLVKGIGSSLNYYDTVDQALANRSQLGTGQLNLEGVVRPGSITPTSTGTDFFIEGTKADVWVVNTGSPPQLFQANIPVVVVGHFDSPHALVFDSNQILVKHSASYIAANPTRVRAPNGTVR